MPRTSRYPLADKGLRPKPRHRFKGGVHGQIPEIRRLPLRVEDHLAQGEAVQHLVEEHLVALFQLVESL
jgi:hypothetical protein